MPWREVSKMDERQEFVWLARQAGANRRELCRRFGIHPDTGYKWLAAATAGEALRIARVGRITSPAANRRARSKSSASGVARRASGLGCAQARALLSNASGLACRRPRRCTRSCSGMAGSWRRLAGRRRISALRRQRRTGSGRWTSRATCRSRCGGRCHPLTIVDDHSRYAMALAACADEQAGTVQERLIAAFRRYGLPDAFFVDNGAPWGDASGRRWTRPGRLAAQARHRRVCTAVRITRRAAARTNASTAR